jgi:hypothetical protein
LALPDVFTAETARPSYPRHPRRAASMVATSIFCIGIIASTALRLSAASRKRVG